MKDDPKFRRALGAGGADEILVENFQHAAAGEPGNRRGISDAENQRGEKTISWKKPAGRVEPPEIDGEKEHQQWTDDEGWHGNAHHPERGRDVIDPRVAPD